jgi:hypothetical protein
MLWDSSVPPHLSLDRDVTKGDVAYIFPRLVLGFSTKCPVCSATEWQRQPLTLPEAESASPSWRRFEIPPIIETVEAMLAERAKELVSCGECGTDGRLPAAEQAKILAFFGMDIKENPELARIGLNPDQSHHLQTMLILALQQSKFTVDRGENRCWPADANNWFQSFSCPVLT